MTLVIRHGGFLPNTTYNITVSGDVLTNNGYRLWGGDYLWTFKTGTEVLS